MHAWILTCMMRINVRFAVRVAQSAPELSSSFYSSATWSQLYAARTCLICCCDVPLCLPKYRIVCSSWLYVMVFSPCLLTGHLVSELAPHRVELLPLPRSQIERMLAELSQPSESAGDFIPTCSTAFNRMQPQSIACKRSPPHSTAFPVFHAFHAFQPSHSPDTHEQHAYVSLLVWFAHSVQRLHASVGCCVVRSLGPQRPHASIGCILRSLQSIAALLSDPCTDL
jgi:hypothetical protein